MEKFDWLESKSKKKQMPEFRSGDQVRVHVRIQESEKERIQIYEGVVLKQHRSGIRSTFTVRKMSYGVGVERVFPLYSPVISQIEVVTQGRVRRSRLYYLRERFGRKARIDTLDQDRTQEKEPTKDKTTADEKSPSRATKKVAEPAAHAANAI